MLSKEHQAVENVKNRLNDEIKNNTQCIIVIINEDDSTEIKQEIDYNPELVFSTKYHTNGIFDLILFNTEATGFSWSSKFPFSKITINCKNQENEFHVLLSEVYGETKNDFKSRNIKLIIKKVN